MPPPITENVKPRIVKAGRLPRSPDKIKINDAIKKRVPLSLDLLCFIKSPPRYYITCTNICLSIFITCKTGFSIKKQDFHPHVSSNLSFSHLKKPLQFNHFQTICQALVTARTPRPDRRMSSILSEGIFTTTRRHLHYHPRMSSTLPEDIFTTTQGHLHYHPRTSSGELGGAGHDPEWQPLIDDLTSLRLPERYLISMHFFVLPYSPASIR